jgi:glycosyltransferase involved in cell wall biosynthesis
VAVHQLVPVLTVGDGVSGAALRFRDLLRKRGYRSDIYADLIDPHLRREARPAAALRDESRVEDGVIYHLSIGSPLAAAFAHLSAQRIVFYQNVTPPESLNGASPVLAHHLRWGLADLAALAPLANLGLAASEFSATELRSAGARQVAVVQLPPDLARLRPRRATPSANVDLLFVGRFAPHKRQDVLIRVLAALRATHAPRATLLLVGSGDLPGYIRGLRELAHALGVAEAVRIETGVSDRALGDLYAKASVFVCASDHEGFGLPVLEAMSFSVPVVAYIAGAVAETVGDGGLLLEDRDPLVWAELAWRMANDDRVRERFISAGLRRLEDFSDAAISAQLVGALATIGLKPEN